MKKILITTIILAALCSHNRLIAQANQSLSNLIAPTAINADMLPSIDNTYNFGSTALRWKKIYTSGDAAINSLTIGRGSGNFITNTALGGFTLNGNTTGINNTASGYAALYNNLDGNNNCATGYAALYNNTSGSGNTASGWYALFYNTTGYSNIAIGIKALYRSTVQYNTVAIGDSTLFNNGIGATYASQGSNNTATGSKALFNNTTGSANTANGSSALYSNTTGYFNTANGYNAIYFTTTGTYNTGSGFGSLFSNVTGSFNTGIGYGSDLNASNYSNSTAIGSNSLITAGNQVRIGNASVTSIGGYANWTNISDGRVKKNIKDNVPGLLFINKLKPVTYNLDLDAADKIVQRPVTKNTEGKNMQPSAGELQAKREKEKVVYSGFVAQQVEQAAKSIGYDFSGVDAAKNDKDLYGLRYAEFVVPLVKSVQELSAQNDAMKSEIGNLKSEIEELKKAIGYQASGINESQSTVNGQRSDVSLSQNIPNPFTHSTTIKYFLPENNGNVFINFYTQSGVLLKSIKLIDAGNGSVSFKNDDLAAGMYTYALIVDGKIIESRQMVLSK